MVNIKAQQAYPASMRDKIFQIVSSSCYRESCDMLSITGLVCKFTDIREIKRLFSSWNFRNFNWSKPTNIDVPELSLQERIALSRHLPLGEESKPNVLCDCLGYCIDDNKIMTRKKLKLYADFYRYYPLFAKIDF